MNAYQFEPPPLVVTDGGLPQLINLTNAEPIPERRSYVFEGNGQALDHVLVEHALGRCRVRGPQVE